MYPRYMHLLQDAGVRLVICDKVSQDEGVLRRKCSIALGAYETKPLPIRLKTEFECLISREFYWETELLRLRIIGQN